MMGFKILFKVTTSIFLIVAFLVFGLLGCSKEKSKKTEKIDKTAQAHWITQETVQAPLSQQSPQEELKKNNPETIKPTPPYLEASSKVLEQEIVQDLIKKANGKTQVIEFFSYGCHWCAEGEPYVEQWLKTKPDNVVFIRVPVLFAASWVNLAKVYYVIEALTMAADHKSLDQADNTSKINQIHELHHAFMQIVKEQSVSWVGKLNLA